MPSPVALHLLFVVVVVVVAFLLLLLSSNKKKKKKSLHFYCVNSMFVSHVNGHSIGWLLADDGNGILR